MAEPLSSYAIPKSPFKFLDYFTGSQEDRRRFGGRDREIHDIVARVTNERTLVLFGPSGIGKTSLLLAGVSPALEERGVRPVYVRTLSSPLADLCHALGGDCGDGESLRQVLARTARDRPVVVVLDQMEELFLRFAPPDREAFAGALAAVVRDRSLQLTVVFSLRVDFLGRLDELGRFLPDLLTHRYALQPLTPFGVRQAVTRPLVDAGIPFEPAVVSRLIAELDDVELDPSWLQILCTELYEAAAARAQGGPVRLIAADVRGLGGRRGVFLEYLNGVSGALPAGQQLLARLMLDALVTAEGTKRAVRLQDLPSAGFYATEEEALAIAGLLVDQRILRRDERQGGDVWYELIHEKLIPVLREWLEGDSELSRFRQARAFVRNNAASDVWKEKPDALGPLETLLAAHRDRFRFTYRELEMVVRNTILFRGSQLPFWQERYGRERTLAVLLEMLGSGREGERVAAAASARHLEDGGSVLARACLRAALEDNSLAVREQAGRSLARLAGLEEIAALRKAQKGERERRVYRAFANMLAEGRELSDVDWWTRQKAERRNNDRILDEQRAAIRERARLGARNGVIAGIVWTVCELVFRILVSSVRSVRLQGDFVRVLKEQGWDWGLFLIAAAVLGGGAGFLTAKAAARHAAVYGIEGRWVSAMLRPSRNWGFLVGWVALCWGVGTAPIVFQITNLSDLRASEAHEWIGLLGFWAVLSLVCVGVAQSSRLFIGLGGSTAGLWMGGLLVSLGLPVFLSLSGIWLLRRFETAFLEGLVAYTVQALVFLSFAVLTALIGPSVRHPLAQTPVVPRKRWSQTFLVLLFLAAALTVTLAFSARFAKEAKWGEAEAKRFGQEIAPPLGRRLGVI